MMIVMTLELLKIAKNSQKGIEFVKEGGLLTLMAMIIILSVHSF